MIIRLCEDIDGATECDLHMRRLQRTTCEICRKFEASLNVIGVFLRNTSPFKLYRDAEKIFASSGNGVSPLFSNFSSAVENRG